MLLTTSAKCVRFYLTPSYLAKQVNIHCAILACFFIVHSDFPLAPSIWLIYLVIDTFVKLGLWVVPLVGELELSQAGQSRCNDDEFSVRRTILLLDKVGILFVLKDGRRRMLWRDSLKEADYRHLLVWLKREH
ncbi:protein YgfX [Vibrio hepatarius]|uniref:protein YgfX n=1 Tax=Vibrio hepatarius TaxID=171383 RepID=UPI003CCB7E25